MTDYTQRGHYPHHPLPQQQPAPDSSLALESSKPLSHAEDLTYIAKYKDLKRKVKQTEIENDRLQLKVLKTRKNIQRLRLERAILYERLATLSGSDTIPFPSDPSIFSAPPPKESLPTRYRNETDIDYSPRDARHIHARHPQSQGPSAAPPRQHARHAEDPPRAGPSRPHNAVPEPEPEPASTHAEGGRNYPFVLEYAQSPVTPAQTTAYPSEVRFYPYETSTHALHRSRRGSEATDLKFRHHRPDAETHSPRVRNVLPMQQPLSSPEERLGKASEETRKRERPNGSQNRKDVHERSRYEYQQHGVGRYPPTFRRDDYSHSEQEQEHQQQRIRFRVDEGHAPQRMPENEAMD